MTNKPHYFSTTLLSTGLSLMMVLSSWASPDAINNMQTPSLTKGTPAKFGFGGENNQNFMLNGKPFQIRGAEIHPQRIPREYWRHRIQTARAMGLNTIAFYTFWNDFEQPNGTFDFKTGNRNIREFLKLCQEEGMWVLFRPGPYICGEWDLGGIPHYLLKDPKAKLRTTEDATFMKAQTRYLEAIAKEAEPFLAKNGGPILMTQLENEYGSYQRKDKKYMEWLHNFWSKKDFGPFYTSDGAGENYLNGVVLPGVAVGLDPGTNDSHWAVANKCNPNVPVFSSETYPGWLRHWGEGNWEPTPGIVDNVRWFMNTGKSFSLFVFHGGTNFGFTAGANNGGKGSYQPDVTSYDYGSPIDEQGRANEYYTQMRNIILDKLPKDAKIPTPPKDIDVMEIPEFTPTYHSGLWEKFTKAFPTKFETPPYFEMWNQNQGLAIYSTTIPAGNAEKLIPENIHDYAQVYLDGKLLGVIDRIKGDKDIDIPQRNKQATLEILVEGMGHINFHISMESDRKGLFGAVKLGDKEIKDWKVRALPLASLTPKDIFKMPKSKTAPSKNREGAHFRAILNIDTPKDTFLDLSKYTKGYVWVNGRNIGRYWNIGPQLRLYVPAPFLRTGKNIIDILDLHETQPQPIRGMIERNKEKGTIKTENLNNQW
ncbi:MAG: beta-galactosidase [Akkermansia sp.]